MPGKMIPTNGTKNEGKKLSVIEFYFLVTCLLVKD
jgi:hypothetical protein